MLVENYIKNGGKEEQIIKKGYTFSIAQSNLQIKIYKFIIYDLSVCVRLLPQELLQKRC